MLSLAVGIIANTPPLGGGGGLPVLDPGVLSVSASAAYSLRKLRTAYAGAAIRVRRVSDNAEQDIGFSGNSLDTSSLTTFCSGTDGYVKTWYDQSGSANNMTQATASAQLRIVNGGSYLGEMDNQASTARSMVVPTAVTSGATAASASAIWRRLADVAGWLDYTGAATSNCTPFSDGNVYEGFCSTTRPAIGALAYPQTARRVITVTHDGTTLSHYNNNSLIGSAATTFTNNPSGKNSMPPSVVACNGGMRELIFFKSALSSGDRNTLTTDQSGFLA